MRSQLNENPVIQAVIVGVLVVAAAFFLFTRVLGSEDVEAVPPPGSEATAAPGVATPAPAAGAPTTGTDGGSAELPAVDPVGAADADAAGATPPADKTSGAAGEGEFVTGPGLPDEVVDAYKDDKAIVLLITRADGISDRALKRKVLALRSRDDVAVFQTPANGIAKYSRIANGVNVERTPALIVVRPRHLDRNAIPKASVSYGFRGSDSVQQTVRDALYEGRDDIPYHPR